MESGAVPEDWSQHVQSRSTKKKKKKDRRECLNYRGISILGILRNIHGRVLISRVMASAKEQVAEEQGGFRSGWGRIDQIFVLKQLVEKYKEKRKELYVAFKDTK